MTGGRDAIEIVTAASYEDAAEKALHTYGMQPINGHLHVIRNGDLRVVEVECDRNGNELGKDGVINAWNTRKTESVTMKPKTQIDKKIRRGRPGSNMESARELMATGWSGTKEDMAARLGITEAQARKVIACVLREERGMKIPQSVTIGGMEFPLLPSIAIKERKLVPFTQPLGLASNKDFFDSVAAEFRRSRIPVYAVNATPNKCHYLQIMLCRDKPASRKNAAHAIPKKHSHKVLRNQPQSV